MNTNKKLHNIFYCKLFLNNSKKKTLHDLQWVHQIDNYMNGNKLNVQINTTPNLSKRNFAAQVAGRGINKPFPSSYESAQNLNKTVNTTAKRNLSGRLSFKGASHIAQDAAEGVAQKATIVAKAVKKEITTKIGTGPLAQKLAKSNKLTKIYELCNDKSLVFEAFYALILAAGLRPVVNILTPAKNTDEKGKNEYRAFHSIASGIIGFIFTFLIAMPIGDAVKKMIKPETTLKYIKKNAALVSSQVGKESFLFQELANRIHQPVFMPIRAMLTVALVQPMLSGMKKKDNKKESLQNASDFGLKHHKHPRVFQNFSGGITNEN